MIIGAGIGGGSAAVALRRAGVAAVVYERSHRLQTFGGGFELWVNGSRAVRSIGLGEQAEAIGHKVEVGQAVTWRGRLLAEWPVGELSRDLGAPVLGVSRPDLHRMFADALDEEAVVLGAECTGYAQDGDGVRVTFADGRVEKADVLIGADGLHSVIRAQMLGPEPPRYAGYTVWRAILDFEHELAPHGLFRLHWGRGVRFLFFRVGPARMYWSAMVKTPPGGVDGEGGHKAAVLPHFRGFVEPVEAMIAATDEGAIIRQDTYDRDPVKRWGEGRVTLLGDAAHPMSPDQGQGANQAIEDGVVIADCLARDGVNEGALRAYEAQRIRRTSEFVRNSRMLAFLGLRENPAVCSVRDRVTKAFNPIFWRQLKKAMDVEF